MLETSNRWWADCRIIWIWIHDSADDIPSSIFHSHKFKYFWIYLHEFSDKEKWCIWMYMRSHSSENRSVTICTLVLCYSGAIAVLLGSQVIGIISTSSSTSHRTRIVSVWPKPPRLSSLLATLTYIVTTAGMTCSPHFSKTVSVSLP